MIRPPAGPALPSISALPILLSLALLSGCGSDKMPQANQSNPVNVEKGRIGASQSELAALPGTPMAQRVAVIGLLNKRNGITRDLSMKPGDALRVGDAIVRLRACEQTAPWEDPPETGAFVQLDVRDVRDNKFYRIFSGWLFKERPDRNVVQHPIYDIWVKSCAMSWPETGPDTVKAGAKDESGSGSGPAESANESSAENAAAPAGAPGAVTNPPAPPKPAAKPAPSATPSSAAPNSDR